jgi:hypothetical protein
VESKNAFDDAVSFYAIPWLYGSKGDGRSVGENYASLWIKARKGTDGAGSVIWQIEGFCHASHHNAAQDDEGQQWPERKEKEEDHNGQNNQNRYNYRNHQFQCILHRIDDGKTAVQGCDGSRPHVLEGLQKLTKRIGQRVAHFSEPFHENVDH